MYRTFFTSQSQTGWKLTCERLRTLKTKRQTKEIEDSPMDESNQTTVPSQMRTDWGRSNPEEMTQQENKSEMTTPSIIEDTFTAVSTDRFQVLEQVCK